MWGRTDHRIVKSLDEVAELVALSNREVWLIFDSDGCIVPQRATEEEFRRATSRVRKRFQALPGVAGVSIITNGSPREAPDVIGDFGKPWRGKARLGLDDSVSTWMVGDQVISDGLFAWRLGARFLQLAISTGDEPRAQARLRRWGRVLAPLILRREPDD